MQASSNSFPEIQYSLRDSVEFQSRCYSQTQRYTILLGWIHKSCSIGAAFPGVFLSVKVNKSAPKTIKDSKYLSCFPNNIHIWCFIYISLDTACFIQMLECRQNSSNSFLGLITAKQIVLFFFNKKNQN